jgi:ribosomal protein L16 Arg81 hydroxylase
MANDTSSANLVLQLAEGCEDVARAALTVAQSQLRAKLITQEVFDQAFQEYGTAMQEARDMYYQASHDLAQQIRHSADFKTLADQTTELKQALSHLKKAEQVLSISFGVVTLVGAIAAAVAAPSSTTLQAALASATSLKQTILG